MLSNWSQVAYVMSQPGRLEVQYTWSHPWYEPVHYLSTPAVLKTFKLPTLTHSGVDKIIIHPTPDGTERQRGCIISVLTTPS